MQGKISVKPILALTVVVFALWMVFFPIAGYSPQFSYSAAVILVTLAGWSTGILPPFLTALIFFALSIIFNLVEAQVLFSGFTSTAVWLIISGFVIGAAISASGLDKKLAEVIAPHLTISYPRLILGLVATAVLLGFIMPSSIGRVVVLIPVGMALAEKVGLGQGSNGKKGVAVALTLACNMPSFAVLPSNIPNMILAGSSETLFGIHFGYMEYLILHFPILGIVKSLLIVGLTLFIFPDKISATNEQKNTIDEQQDASLKTKQFRVAVILSITLLFWITDSIHGVNAAWVGLSAAIFLLLPKWGVVEPKSFNRSVDFGTVIFVSAALGLGALVNSSGVGAYMGELFSYLLPGSTESSWLNFMALSLISVLTGIVTTIPGVPTVLSPMAADFSQLTGFSIPAVLMTQVIGFSTVIFPYQVAPLIVAMQLAKQSLSDLLKVTLPLAVITLIVLIPLDYLWWSMLGWIH